MTTLSRDEITFDPRSFVDASGRLFWWKDELYRGITAEKSELYRGLFQKGIVGCLVEKGLLVQSEIAPLKVDGFDLTLKHRLLPFVSFPHEWAADMLKDAALMVLDLEIALAAEGLTLQDAHPWNVLFDGAKPVWIDFGSIGPARDGDLWGTQDEFTRYFLNPLLLISRGHERIARWLLRDFDKGVGESDVFALSGVAEKLRSRISARLSPPRRRGDSTARHDFLKALRQRIEVITFPKAITDWSNYYDSLFPSFMPSTQWTTKHETVFKVLSELKPTTVLDIGSNQGWFSQLAASLGSKVVAFDVDEPSVTKMYADARSTGCDVLPLIMDIRNPTPAGGLCYKWFPSATDRLHCDLVMVLAVVHHLVFKQSLNFDQIADALLPFTKDSLLIEFIPPDDQYVREWKPERFPWYSLEKFTEAFQRRFHEVRILPCHPDLRVLLHATKRRV